jgi:Zn-finger nucleic acid-binding protein/predicted RNA-binding Zn-ribbon protein involved in translation (DUF1610 family)
MTNAPLKSGVYNCPNCGAAASPESVRCAYCHSSLATLVCSKCYGAIFIGMNHCPWCGEDAETGSPSEKAEGKCPRCNIDFLLVEVNKNLINECSSCGGLWVNNNTFQKICSDQEERQAILDFNPELMKASGISAVQSGRAYVPCPVCKQLMNRRQFAGCSGVIIDSCKAHGAWFDRNELRQIVQFIQAGGLNKARKKELLDLEEEKQKLREERWKLERFSNIDSGASHESNDSDMLSLMGGLWSILKKD